MFRALLHFCVVELENVYQDLVHVLFFYGVVWIFEFLALMEMEAASLLEVFIVSAFNLCI